VRRLGYQLERPGGPFEWLTETESADFRPNFEQVLGVRPMRFFVNMDDFDRLPPEDRPSEQWIADQLAYELESTQDDAAVVSIDSWLRIPLPSVTYDLDRGLGEQGTTSFAQLSEALHACTLTALRVCTAADEWIYAVDEPEGKYSCFRFWPHRLDADGYWRVTPVPDGDDQVFLSRDFEWGMYAIWGFDDSTDRALSIFGRPMLDAVSALAPAALTYPIRIDGQLV
jgi:Protein of unknown function (DUF2716)